MLQELTNKIKKIIPEIEELKFGCKFICDEAEYTILFKRFYVNENIPHDIKAISGNAEETFASEYIKENCEIIGRDINLEDVLRCLQISQPTSWFYVVTAYGRILSAVSNNLSNGSVTYEDTGIYWHLGKPLHEQSEETIKELNKLI